MLVKTILNHIQKYSSFVYGDATMYKREENLILDSAISPRKNSRPICSKCGVHSPGYDHMPAPRRFEYIPIWGILVFFVYTMRRVDCPTCGASQNRGDIKIPLETTQFTCSSSLKLGRNKGTLSNKLTAPRKRHKNP